MRGNCLFQVLKSCCLFRTSICSHSLQSKIIIKCFASSDFSLFWVSCLRAGNKFILYSIPENLILFLENRFFLFYNTEKSISLHTKTPKGVVSFDSWFLISGNWSDEQIGELELADWTLSTFYMHENIQVGLFVGWQTTLRGDRYYGNWSPGSFCPSWSELKVIGPSHLLGFQVTISWIDLKKRKSLQSLYNKWDHGFATWISISELQLSVSMN